MSELDVAKEQITYLKFWLGILVVTDISLFGWLLSNVGERKLAPRIRRLFRSCGDYRGDRAAAPPYRAAHRKIAGALDMEIIVAVLLVAVSLVFLAIVVDATRDRK